MNGWRFYSADNSTNNECFVLLKRMGKEEINWFKLSDEQKDAIKLYVHGHGCDLPTALKDAWDAAYKDEGYKILETLNENT